MQSRLPRSFVLVSPLARLAAVVVCWNVEACEKQASDACAIQPAAETRMRSVHPGPLSHPQRTHWEARRGVLYCMGRFRRFRPAGPPTLPRWGMQLQACMCPVQFVALSLCHLRAPSSLSLSLSLSPSHTCILGRRHPRSTTPPTCMRTGRSGRGETRSSYFYYYYYYENPEFRVSRHFGERRERGELAYQR